MDIVGLNKEAEMVLAQVTFSKDSETLKEKADALEASRPIGQLSKCFLFCDAQYSCKDYPKMVFTPVRQVSDDMLKKRPHWIDVMLGKRIHKSAEPEQAK